MVQKRGVSLVLLLLVIGLSFSALSIDPSQSENYALYQCSNIGDSTDKCGGDGVDINKPVSLATRSSFAICDPGHDNLNFQKYDYPSEDGCWFAAANVAGTDQSLWVTLVEGSILQPWDQSQIFHQSGGTISSSFTNAVYRGEMAPEYYDGYLRTLSSPQNEVSCFMPSLENDGWWIGGAYLLDLQSEGAAICAEDHMWHECKGGEGGNEGKVAWANNHLYRCQQDDYRWIWFLIGVDQDHDSYIASSTDPTIPIDCADNPSAEGLRTEGCPENNDGCSLEFSTCAICINPSSPEICGDGVDNDCSDTLNYLPDTSDDCSLNQLSCEQQNDVKLIRRGTEATFINEFNEEISLEEAEAPAKSYRNDKNQAFSYNPSAEVGQNCCGYNGISDLGNLNNDQSKICLKDDNEVVGTTGANPSDTLNFDLCTTSDWCWVPASGRSKFQIATLKEPGQSAYDIVSDSGKWHQCQEPTTPEYLFTRSLASSFEEPVEDVSAGETINRFACYKEGDHSSWAECASEYNLLNNRNVKGRLAGDGLYSLPLPTLTAPTNNIEIRPDSQIYASDGNDAYFYFTDYTHLEFFVRFKNGADTVSWEQLNLPADIRLTIYGPPGDDGSPQIYIQKSVLGDVQNRPVFSAETWMHIRTNIPENLQLVSKIELSSVRADGTLSNDNKIEVSNAFVSTGEGSPICSGDENSAGTNWLSDFDDGDEVSFNAKKMCIARYGDKAWLGNDFETETVTANCCGNSPNEYYAGPVAESTGSTETARYGCW